MKTFLLMLGAVLVAEFLLKTAEQLYWFLRWVWADMGVAKGSGRRRWL